MPNDFRPLFHECNKCKVKYKDAEKWAFCSQAWKACAFEYISLKTIHRQSDRTFIDMLEKCRLGGTFDAGERKILLEHTSETTNAIKIFPLRASVDEINEREFQKLRGPTCTYQCLNEHYWNDLHISLRDYFNETWNNPVPKALRDHQYQADIALRPGTVIVLLNNLEIDKGLVNGSIGKVIGFKDIEPDKIPEYKGSDASQKRESLKLYIANLSPKNKKWPLIRFDNGVTRLIKADCRIKSFRNSPSPRSWVSRTQLPLLPAWAMTVHKAQGMTLSRVEVDLRRVFEAGHDYVALSRAKTLEGLKVVGLPDRQIGGNREVLGFLREKFGVGLERTMDASVVV